jgi:hypothetical protein
MLDSGTGLLDLILCDQIKHVVASPTCIHMIPKIAQGSHHDEFVYVGMRFQEATRRRHIQWNTQMRAIAMATRCTNAHSGCQTQSHKHVSYPTAH